MNVSEANRARHLVIRLDRGEELPTALVRALDKAEARAGFITGVGALEAAELAQYDQTRRTYERARRIDAPCEVLSLSGNVAVLDGGVSVRLWAVLSRETDVGLGTLAGQSNTRRWRMATMGRHSPNARTSRSRTTRNTRTSATP
jgi:predicted DNA-binding protein with PD1-like motif